MPADRMLKLLVLLLLLAGSGPADAAGFRQTAGGVGYRDLQTGSGRLAKIGDVVTVQVTGWVRQQGPPERAFVDTRKEGQPVQFRLGTTRVMPGWNEGIPGMRAGGRRLLRIPPRLGYGARSVEDIPPGSTLVFLVELLAVEPAAR